MTLTKKHLDTLRRFIPASDDWTGVCVAGGRVPKIVLELDAAGLLKDEGVVELDDGDGYSVKNADGAVRMRRAFSVTDAGRKALDAAGVR